MAPILNVEKTQYFLLNCAQTLFGVSLQQPSKVITFIGYFLPPLAVVLCSALVTDIVLAEILGTLIPVGILSILKVAEYCVRKREEQETKCGWREIGEAVARVVLVAGYCWLATRHLKGLVEIYSYNLFGLSIVTLTTSLSTLHSASVKEFGMQS